MSTTPFQPERLDVRIFAQYSGMASGILPLLDFGRLASMLWTPDTHSSSSARVQECVSWSVRGRTAGVSGGALQYWLDLEISAQLPMQCQRCLQGVQHELHLQRSFRFVRTEAEALALDEDSDEDVLSAAETLNLLQLVEDELIMSIPFAPMHDVCPVAVQLQSSDADFEASMQKKPNAFDALNHLLGKRH